MSTSPSAASAGVPSSPDINLKVARTLAASASEFETWIEEEIEALACAQARLAAIGPTEPAMREFGRAVDVAMREAAVLGYPLVGRICESIKLVLGAADPADMPHDVIEAHIRTMSAVATDRTLTSERANRLVAALAAAARDYIGSSPNA